MENAMVQANGLATRALILLAMMAVFLQRAAHSRREPGRAANTD